MNWKVKMNDERYRKEEFRDESTGPSRKIIRIKKSSIPGIKSHLERSHWEQEWSPWWPGPPSNGTCPTVDPVVGDGAKYTGVLPGRARRKSPAARPAASASDWPAASSAVGGANWFAAETSSTISRERAWGEKKTCQINANFTIV